MEALLKKYKVKFDDNYVGVARWIRDTSLSLLQTSTRRGIQSGQLAEKVPAAMKNQIRDLPIEVSERE